MTGELIDLIARGLARRSSRRGLIAGSAALIAARLSGAEASQSCGFGEETCSGTFGGADCVNLDFDDDNCGACGSACDFGLSCSFGSCQCTLVGATSCPGTFGGVTCINPDFDDDNCGACGNACDFGLSCSFGSCACANVGATPCSSSTGGTLCVDLNSDEENCGACGRKCDSSETCRNGICTPQTSSTNGGSGGPPWGIATVSLECTTCADFIDSLPIELDDLTKANGTSTLNPELFDFAESTTSHAWFEQSGVELSPRVVAFASELRSRSSVKSALLEILAYIDSNTGSSLIRDESNHPDCPYVLLQFSSSSSQTEYLHWGRSGGDCVLTTSAVSEEYLESLTKATIHAMLEADPICKDA
ncbi:hypothetical protein BH09CHL1_BH09CHL1_34770 [soil metagenome]